MRNRRMRQSGWGVVLLGLCLSSLGWAHSDLEPRQSLPKRWETYTLLVPTETAAATVKVRLRVPDAFTVEAVKHLPPWHLTTVRDEKGVVREIVWEGGRIPSQRFEEFRFLARNPAETGTYRWHIEQYAEGGEVATWEAQTQIVPMAATLAQRAEEAWRTAQVATTVSFIAIGVAGTLILVLVVVLLQRPRATSRKP
ncbi:MAG: hypothetical protein KatS3mg131_0768 [Candidatus Tectimicrobiota bacterium]|nr:MAG: hypothetical protein KatS3mg131_0768 [Candidatus Tectomicrobia bacterium]